MADRIFERLAECLDAIPNGFARTESGVELELLKKLFTPEEARIACEMRLAPETPEAIGGRTGLDAVAAGEALARMRAKGLIRAVWGESGATYMLMPFIVGIYEDQLERMDEEFANLFERWMVETQGGSNADGASSVHRVIPVAQSVPMHLEIFPYEQATEMLNRARAWGVRDCICRVQQKMIGKGCDHTIENCLVFAPREGVFDKSESIRVISKDEAHRVLQKAADEGLVHSTMNQQEQIFYICNCCTCCCGVMRGVAEFGVPTAVARSDFRVTIDDERCTGCGACVRRCQFEALSKDGDVAVADYVRCVGCGVCVSACPVETISMERRPAGEVEAPPLNLRHWMAMRSEERGLTEQDAE